MIGTPTSSAGAPRFRPGPGRVRLVLSLMPALLLVTGLFGGGLLLGAVQALGYLPGAGLTTIGLEHVANVVGDPDFLHSLGLTLYIATTATIVAAVCSVAAALALLFLAPHSRVLNFIFQIPLTVPHLVIAVAVMFMLSPTGLLSRLASAAGVIRNSSGFPLLVNDTLGIGIMTVYIWKEIPFMTLMILASLRNAGVELLDVGRTLKASRWQRLRHIILPTIWPSLGAASLIVFAYTFGAFEVPFLLGRTYPMLLPVWAYKNYSDVDLLARPEGIATGLIIAAVVAVAVVISQQLDRAADRRRNML